MAVFTLTMALAPVLMLIISVLQLPPCRWYHQRMHMVQVVQRT